MRELRSMPPRSDTARCAAQHQSQRVLLPQGHVQQEVIKPCQTSECQITMSADNGSQEQKAPCALSSQTKLAKVAWI